MILLIIGIISAIVVGSAIYVYKVIDSVAEDMRDGDEEDDWSL